MTGYGDRMLTMFFALHAGEARTTRFLVQSIAPNTLNCIHRPQVGEAYVKILSKSNGLDDKVLRAI